LRGSCGIPLGRAPGRPRSERASSFRCNRKARAQFIAAVWLRPRCELPADDGDSLAHPHEPMPPAAALSVAVAVVAHDELDGAVGVADVDLSVGGTRVLERVSEPFLHEP